MTLKVAFKSFLRTFWFKKMHHYTKFGCKWYCHTEDFIQTKTRQMNKLIIDSFKIHKYPPPPKKKKKKAKQNKKIITGGREILTLYRKTPT